jgi:hypothetical protein
MLSVFLRMTKNITKVIYEKEKMMLETAALFISSCYGLSGHEGMGKTCAPIKIEEKV